MKVKKLYYPTDVGYTTQTAKNVISLAQKEMVLLIMLKKIRQR